MPSTRSRTYGFTLAELAVAFVIIALLLGGALIPLSAQVEIRNITDTRKQLEDIKEALMGFALTQGRLPCPADPTIATGAANSGIERASCSGATLIGVVPWATLGVREGDSWGRRFTYRVTSAFADAIAAGTYGAGCTPNPTPTLSSYALCSVGDMTVNTRNISAKTSSATASNVVAVIISHGKNGYGANQPTATYVVSPPAANADEAANTIASATATSFMSREQSGAAGGCSDTAAGVPPCEFDDIVIWIPYTTLISRTVTAGRLP